ncbi:hypothetical protein [Fredinandcohnia onubensis]|uniref:hypothetical protein n=1 Tax=Fredinandcohnia onubensis TaxID=1571209 RepID=UPI0015D4731C|nr:hypothetical protein [Fredinandcohnia onubensis]
MSFTNIFLKIRSNFMYLPTLYGIVAFLMALLSIKLESIFMKQSRPSTHHSKRALYRY